MNINRKDFIKKLGAGIAVMCGIPVYFNCSGIKRGDIPNDQTFKSLKKISKHEYEILKIASLAPSGHNMQPWFVRPVESEKWIIGIDKERLLPAVDPQNREALLSIGAFIENLSMTAGYYGFKTEISVKAKNPFEENIAVLKLIKTKPGRNRLDLIKKRRTVKHGFLNIELKNRDIKELMNLWKGHIFYFPKKSKHSECIAEGAVEAFREQTYRDAAQKELAGAIRFTDIEAEKMRYGLTTEGMEIAGIKGWFVRNLLNKDDVMKKSFREGGIDIVSQQVKEGSGWIIITSRGKRVSDLIEAGRHFERLALLAREKMIAIHPMTQMLEEKKWQNRILSTHRPDIIPQFILRAGYLNKYPEPVTLRRPVSWFLKT